MVQPQQGISLDPETFSEGGGPPIDKNLRITAARFEHFDYDGKAPRAFVARLDLVDDSGQTYNQRYTVGGDPNRFSPSPDGHLAIPMVAGAKINNASNLGILITALVSCQFPKEKLAQADISCLDGLYAYWIGMPEPESRKGLAAQGETRRASVILVPSQIIQQAVNGAAPVAAAPVAAMPPGMQAQAPIQAPVAAPVMAPQAAPVMAAPPGVAVATAPTAPNAGAASILASVAKVSAATNGVFSLQQIFPQVQADYPAEAMTLLPQVPTVLAANGYQVDPQTQNVLKVT